MTARYLPALFCDHTDCSRYIVAVEPTTKSALRRRAEDEGWETSQPFDWCPDHVAEGVRR